MQRVGVVLAGGRSRRFGAPKTAARFHGRPLLDHAVRLLGEAVGDVRIVGHPPGPLPPGVRSRPDPEPGAGPLAALETALQWGAEEGADTILILAVDMPLVPPSLLRDIALCSEPGIVVPESGGPAGMEPLCARYPVGLAAYVASLRAEGERSLRALIVRAGAVRVPSAHIQAHGPPERIFLNVNTPADLSRAETFSR